MAKADSAAHEQTSANLGGGRFIAQMMAIDEVERKLIAADPRLRQEIRFQAVALVVSPTSFWYAVFNVATSLLEQSTPGALVIAAVAAFGLFAIDKHYLIQSRGNSSEDIRKAIYKIRAVSMLIITLSFMLMATDTFRADIDRVLAEAKQAKRMELAQSPRYKLERDNASEVLIRAGQSSKRKDELQAQLAQLQVGQARAWEERRNQCEGNTTGNQSRVAGCGREARGADAAANRLGLEIEAAKQELAQLGNASEQLAEAKQQWAAIDARIDQDADRSIGGPSRKLDALWTLLRGNFSAGLAISFWFLIGTLPDILMFIAQSRMFNHDLFTSMRALQSENLQAQIAQLRRQLRQQQADRLTPIEVRIETTVPPASAEPSDRRRQPKSKAEELA